MTERDPGAEAARRALLERALQAGLVDPAGAQRAWAVCTTPGLGPDALRAALRAQGIADRVAVVLAGAGGPAAGPALGASWTGEPRDASHAGGAPPGGPPAPDRAPGGSQAGDTRADASARLPRPAPGSAPGSGTRAGPGDTRPDSRGAGPPGATPPGSGAGGLRLPGQRFAPGDRLGPFAIVRELGRGGMGVVLEGRDDAGRRAAIKVMLDLAGSETLGKRFARETDALRRLDHPHVVRYLDAGEAPQPWLAMEFVEGRDLAQHLARGPLAAKDAARLVAQAAAAVAHAHRLGIVHRDLKPSNVLVREGDGAAIVSDFGLARRLDQSRMTRSGASVGTLSYMAPEQVHGARDVGPPADVWALGAILYRCLTGRDPFEEASPMATMAAIVEASPTSPRRVRADVPVDLERTALACLARDPAARPTASQVAQALRARRALGRGGPPRALVAGGVVFALALAGAGLVAGGAFDRAGPAPAPGPPARTGAADPTAPPTAADAPAPVDPGPWPAPPAPWRRAWALGERALLVDRPALWREPGRLAAPVAAVVARAPGAVEAAYLGAARAAEGARVVVRYDDLARALRPLIDTPGTMAHGANPDAARVAPLAGHGPDAAALLAPNDTSYAHFAVGHAAWADVAVRARLRRVAPEDQDELHVYLARDAEGDMLAGLRFSGRAARATWVQRPEQVSAPGGLADAWAALALEPGAPAGRRVLLDGRAQPELDAAAARRPPSASIELSLVEAHVALTDLEVEGRPLATDVPAAAACPLPLGPLVRIAASFALEDDPAARDAQGGPFLALEAPAEREVVARWGPALGLGASDGGAAGVRVRLDGAALVVERQGLVLHRQDLPRAPRRGWLALARGLDRLDVELVADPAPGAGGGDDAAQGGRLRVALTLADPLPRPGAGDDVRALWGSTGPTCAFAHVEAFAAAGPDAPGSDAEGPDAAGPDAAAPGAAATRRAFDAAAAEGASAALEGAALTDDARTRWRRAALRLATATSQGAWLDRALLGLEATAPRRAAARQAARELEEAAAGLPGWAAQDALARAVLAHAAAADGPGAANAARALVAAAGPAAARAALDGLERGPTGAPALAARLATGWTSVYDPEVRLAALEAAAVLVPDRELDVLFHRAGTLIAVGRRAVDTPDGRRMVEQGVDMQRQVLARDPARKPARVQLADGLTDLGRHAEALEAWDAVVAEGGGTWWTWTRRTGVLAALGRGEHALESGLGALAVAAGRRQVWELVASLCRQVDAPGLVAAALSALADVGAGDRLRADAEARARAALAGAAGARDRDLAAYVLARAGERPGPEVTTARATGTLALARAGDPAARDALAAAATADPLVRHLATLDPALAPLLR